MKQLILEKNEIHEKHVKENKEPKIFDQVKCLPKQMNSLFGSNNLTDVKNTLISLNFLVWKFCAKAEFPHSFGRFARNYVETLPLHKISIPGN